MLGAEQEAAVEAARAWWHKGSPESQSFTLTGYAGTGKTTLVQHIVDELAPRDVVYGAFTGKATQVLRDRNGVDANTIHSLIYIPRQSVKQKLLELEGKYYRELNPFKRSKLKDSIREEQKRANSPGWVPRKLEESRLKTADLIVLDEVSMIETPLGRDLMSYEVPVLALGDPMQLPPINGETYFDLDNPNAHLTEIHRSAKDSIVTKVATAVRKRGSYGLKPDLGLVTTPGESLVNAQVLVGRNATRFHWNQLIRTAKGFSEPLPQQGEKIIVLANNYEYGVRNGEMFTVENEPEDPDDEGVLQLEVRGTGKEQQLVKLPVWSMGFTDGKEGEDFAKQAGRGDVCAATFGYAITTHKAQGSQWPEVLVIDESAVFRDKRKQWIYTAVTRAQESIKVLRPRFS